MDKNTLIAVILSVIVITGGFMLQGVLFPPEPQAVIQETKQSIPETSNQANTNQQSTIISNTSTNTNGNSGKVNGLIPWENDGLKPVDKEIVLETDLLTVTFSTKGGTVSSLKLKEHLDNNEPLEMIQNRESGVNAFNIYFGSSDAPAVDELFFYKKVNSYTY